MLPSAGAWASIRWLAGCAEGANERLLRAKVQKWLNVPSKRPGMGLLLLLRPGGTKHQTSQYVCLALLFQRAVAYESLTLKLRQVMV